MIRILFVQLFSPIAAARVALKPFAIPSFGPILQDLVVVFSLKALAASPGTLSPFSLERSNDHRSLTCFIALNVHELLLCHLLTC